MTYLVPLNCHPRPWRNWQTRKIQVLVSARTWRFDSSWPHRSTLDSRGFFLFNKSRPSPQTPSTSRPTQRRCSSPSLCQLIHTAPACEILKNCRTSVYATSTLPSSPSMRRSINNPHRTRLPSNTTARAMRGLWSTSVLFDADSSYRFSAIISEKISATLLIDKSKPPVSASL